MFLKQLHEMLKNPTIDNNAMNIGKEISEVYSELVKRIQKDISNISKIQETSSFEKTIDVKGVKLNLRFRNVPQLSVKEYVPKAGNSYLRDYSVFPFKCEIKKKSNTNFTLMINTDLLIGASLYGSTTEDKFINAVYSEIREAIQLYQD